MSPRQKEAIAEHFEAFGLRLADAPWDINVSFGRNAPLVLEIGFGMGDALLEMARVHPEINYLGIEVHRPGVGALLAGIHELGISNIRVCSEDAVEVFKKAIPDGALDAVHLFFPDPWPKRRHHKRRIVQPEFVVLVARKLKKGGVFHMATDWEDYAHHMMAVLEGCPDFENTSGKGQFSPRPEERPLTKFEKRGQRLKHGVWDLIFFNA